MTTSPEPPKQAQEPGTEPTTSGRAAAPAGGPTSGTQDQTQQPRGGGLAGVRAQAGGQGLVRPRRGRLLAGVAAGLGQRFGVSPWVPRVIFVLSLFLPGPQFLVYVVLWAVMPSES
jgi:phage shock protein C